MYLVCKTYRFESVKTSIKTLKTVILCTFLLDTCGLPKNRWASPQESNELRTGLKSSCERGTLEILWRRRRSNSSWSTSRQRSVTDDTVRIGHIWATYGTALREKTISRAPSSVESEHAVLSHPPRHLHWSQPVVKAGVISGTENACLNDQHICQKQRGVQREGV